MSVDINGTTGVTTPGLASTAMPTSGGDPVVESGSNSDGEWVRWADGTQEVHFIDPATVTATTAISGISLYSVNKNLTFPAPFLSIPEISPGFGRVVGSIAHFGAYRYDSVSATAFDIYGVATTNTSTGRLQYRATGRWK